MEEFWVCQHCRSLNRAGASKCYSCRNKYGTRPKAPDSPTPSGSVGPAPVAPMPLADFSRAPAPPPPFTRPVALAPAATATGGALGAAGGRGLANPVTGFRSRVASSLAMRQSVSIAWLGYVTAALLALALLVGAVVTSAAMPVAASLLQHADAGLAWAQLSAGQQSFLVFVSIGLVLVGAVALLSFSVFIGLTTHNATGLGADQPLLIPYRAGISWATALWTQVRIAVALIVPAALLWRGYSVLGLIGALVAVEIAHRNLDDVFGWVSRPYRHLPDLYSKLGVQGPITSPLASMWSVCFRIANLMAVGLSAMPLIAYFLLTASELAGHSDLVGWQSNGLGPIQVAVALLAASLIGWTAISVALLIPLSIGLVARQRTRKTLVRVGRSRSWVARPGEGGYSPSAQTPAEHSGGYDEDRLVERIAGYGSPAENQDRPTARPDFAGSGAGGSGFGGPGAGGAGLLSPRPGLGGSVFGGQRPDNPDFGGPGQGQGSGFGGRGPGRGSDFGGPGFQRPRARRPRSGLLVFALDDLFVPLVGRTARRPGLIAALAVVAAGGTLPGGAGRCRSLVGRGADLLELLDESIGG